MQTNRHIVQTTMSHTGTFVIVEVKDLPFNGTVLIKKGSFKEKVNNGCIHPFFPQSS